MPALATSIFWIVSVSIDSSGHDPLVTSQIKVYVPGLLNVNNEFASVLSSNVPLPDKSVHTPEPIKGISPGRLVLFPHTW